MSLFELDGDGDFLDPSVTVRPFIDGTGLPPISWDVFIDGDWVGWVRVVKSGGFDAHRRGQDGIPVFESRDAAIAWAAGGRS